MGRPTVTARRFLPALLAALMLWVGTGPALADDDRLPGGRFLLIDQDGAAVTDADFRGEFLLIYFGYTFCPDVCPTSLSVMSDAMDMLDEATAERIRPIFISVDPARDTPEVLGHYVQSFHPRMIALTGTEAMLERMARDYKIIYEFVREPGAEPDDYLVDHSSSILLMGPDGRFLRKFVHGVAPEQIVAAIREFLP